MTERPSSARPSDGSIVTLPGVLLYERYGFRETERSLLRMPDDVEIGAVAMEMPITS